MAQRAQLCAPALRRLRESLGATATCTAVQLLNPTARPIHPTAAPTARLGALQTAGAAAATRSLARAPLPGASQRVSRGLAMRFRSAQTISPRMREKRPRSAQVAPAGAAPRARALQQGKHRTLTRSAPLRARCAARDTNTHPKHPPTLTRGILSHYHAQKPSHGAAAAHTKRT